MLKFILLKENTVFLSVCLSPQARHEAEEQKGREGLYEGGGKTRHPIHQQGDDEGVASAIYVPEAAPDVAPHHHAFKGEGGRGGEKDMLINDG